MRPLEPGKGFSRTTLIDGGQGQVRKDRKKGRMQNEDGPRKRTLLSFLYHLVVQRIPNLRDVLLYGDGAGRADRSALAAVHAAAISEFAVESRSDFGVGAAEIGRAHV